MRDQRKPDGKPPIRLVTPESETPEQLVQERPMSWRGQLRLLGRIGLIVYLPTILLLGVALVQQRVPIPALFRDLNSVADLPFYAGFYSQFGAVLWCATATVCLFSWIVLRRAGADPEWQRFLLAAGALTSLLLFDDLFMFHESILPRALPWAELIMYLFYAVAGVAFLFRFRWLILRTDYLLLLASLGLLGFSLTTDVWSTYFFTEVSETVTGYRILVEDGAKLLGIAGWLAYFTIVCVKRFDLIHQSAGYPGPSIRRPSS